MLTDEWDELVSEGPTLTSADGYGVKALAMDISTMLNGVDDLTVDIFYLYEFSGKVFIMQVIFLYYLFEQYWTVLVATWRHILNDFATSSTLSNQIWHHPFYSTPGPDFTKVEPVVVTGGLLSTIASSHVDSIANDLTSTRFPSVHQPPMVSFNPFSYNQYTSGRGMHPTFPKLTPYYSPYRVHQNGYSLAGSDKLGYNSQPNPGDAVQLGGLPQVDCSRSAAHLEYSPPLSGFGM
ncbi:hypothetical protein Nepgr_003803 [Nepenthes gracilis]|uniref:Uncharacterized protein n=1 Tax=Nepenthes gracilis TaxID=150966 RepID=A0AAD3XE64_NEPGR|nr:hypothetical protein Nepgr_003803 [Nepenthes gracilis]